MAIKFGRFFRKFQFRSRVCCSPNQDELLLQKNSEPSPPPPSADLCYVFSFDAPVTDVIGDITYNGGSQTFNANVSLNQLQEEIEAALETAFDGVPITYEDIMVISEVNAGAGTYTITIKNPSIDVSIMDVSGNSFPATETDCT